MGIFKDLLSRHLLRRSSTPSLQTARCHSISEAQALSCCAAAAAPAKSAPAGAEDEEEEEELPMLSWYHPHTIRVRRMAGDLIAAACDDRNYGRRRLSESIRRHFAGINWAVGVVDAGYVNGFSTATGGIVVSTGLLGYLRSEAAVASVLGHEVGHVIARHAEERDRNWLLVGLLAHFAGELLDAPPGDRAPTRSSWMSLFMRSCYFSREYEADRLGLLLLAAAGYDPRAGLQMYRKLGEVTGDAAPDDVRATHPASTKRAQRLSEAKLMEEAMDLYRQAVRCGKGAGAMGYWRSTFENGLPCHAPDGPPCGIKETASSCCCSVE